jgi:hypothetical protein
MLDIFAPMAGLLSDDVTRLTAIRETYRRAHRRPTPLCSACDYEFRIGECPSLMYCTRPIIAKAEEYLFIAGAICPQCALKSNDRLMEDIVGYLRRVKPDITIGGGGHA